MQEIRTPYVDLECSAKQRREQSEIPKPMPPWPRSWSTSSRTSRTVGSGCAAFVRKSDPPRCLLKSFPICRNLSCTKPCQLKDVNTVIFNKETKKTQKALADTLRAT